MNGAGRAATRSPTMHRMPREQSFRLEELEPDELLERLRERFRLRAERPWTVRRTYTDTFDWRLHRAGRTLSQLRRRRERALELADLDGRALASVAGNGLPAFREDLPQGWGAELLEVLDVRRLLPLVRVEADEHEHAVLDDEGKTVVRLVLERARARPPSGRAAHATPLPVRARVRPVRGYEDEFDAVVAWFAHERGLEPEPATTFETALQAVGRAPRDYSSKLAVRLDPGERSDRAMKRVLTELAHTIERNAAGTIEDLDSEFLHDLRVATRRTRVALARVKGVFEPERVQHFSGEFRWLGGVTGPARDLDVLALKLDEYLARLAATERASLEPLTARIADERARAQRKLARTLKSTRFSELIASWQAFLAEPEDEHPAAKKALVPIGELARKRLRRTFARTLEAGASVGATSPDADVHALRIQCKKLRYLLEFFRSLFPPSEVDALVKALKGLQTVLGDFNDYAVHRDHLEALAPSLPAGAELALGALLEHLRLGKERERAHFEERFEAFAGRANRARAERLFGKAGAS